MPLPSRHTSRSHIFITHEFYPRRGGIATFVEELGLASHELAGNVCSIDADVTARTPNLVYPLTRGSEETSETEAHDIEVWAQALPSGGRKVAEKEFPFRVRRLPLRGTHNLRCLVALARVLFAERERLREASVYLVEPGPILAFLWLQFSKTLRPRELCLTFHGSEILKLHRCPLRRALTRRLIRRAARVSTLTQYTRDLLFERFPEARARFVLTPGALRSEVAAPSSWRANLVGSSGDDEVNADSIGKWRAAAIKNEAESRPRLVVLTVGRLHPRKGQLHTLNALAALRPELQRKVEYWLVGTATGREGKRYEHRLRERASELAPTLAVRFWGDVPGEELGTVYAQADIFALTSVAHGTSIEGFGLVYLEAAAHGLPIIAHDIGGVSEAVSHGHTGLLVAPNNDPSALRDAFARLIEDAELRARLGAAGPAWARRQSWHDSAAALIGACRSPCHSRRRET